jgi:hypothetical protein
VKPSFGGEEEGLGDDEWDRPAFDDDEENLETIGYKGTKLYSFHFLVKYLLILFIRYGKEAFFSPVAGNLVDIIMEQKKQGVRTEDLEKELEDYYKLDYEAKVGDKEGQ